MHTDEGGCQPSQTRGYTHRGAVSILLVLPVALARNSTCCEALRGAGLAHVLYPNSTAYENRTESYWSVSAQLTPYCIVQPTCTSDVVKVVNTLLKGAACSSTKFAVRGGHTTWAGAAKIDDGVTVDMGFIKTVTLDKNASTASIGTGAFVGVGGFMTGGGNSFFLARQGFACDNVKNFEMVTANGDIVHANADENPDLWQALKGGAGANFGILTRYDMYAFRAGNLWGGTATYNKSTSAEHIAAYVKWTDNVNKYTAGSNILIWTYLPSLVDIVILTAYEDTEGNEWPAGFEGFKAIPRITDTLRIDSHKGLIAEFEIGYRYRDIWFTMTFANDPEVYTKIVEFNQAFVDERKASSDDPDFGTQCMTQSIPTIFSKHSVEKGGNIMGLDKLDHNVVMLLSNIAVKTAEQEAVARPPLRYYGEKMQDFAASKGGLIDWVYLNYADWYQDPLASYGADNVEKIRTVVRKFDPQGIFQTKAPGGFKISKVGTGSGAGVEERALYGDVM
ncbi:FAD-binding domain-containing protein [Bimuria novae-zelandiae CBS 107.79]|uniref:FAD-binding domain-containing protein n=1 Tax=Bimuria novae-zelandiae CBS 107.79 TaxID=1447943 RepID=A0A6A5VQX6_9PLEO|nr:FAD-binding domain-containing protein [Bimuria novae-zelandiae CBS 107.79]